MLQLRILKVVTVENKYEVLTHKDNVCVSILQENGVKN